jgi:hypothetical protein
MSDTIAPGPMPFPAELLKDDPVHPGFVLTGVDGTPGQKAYYIHLEAKPGKGEQVQNFLRDILKGVEQEPLTGPWFANRYSDTHMMLAQVGRIFYESQNYTRCWLIQLEFIASMFYSENST